jgi:hypothetical protein
LTPGGVVRSWWTILKQKTRAWQQQRSSSFRFAHEYEDEYDYEGELYAEEVLEVNEDEYDGDDGGWAGE